MIPLKSSRSNSEIQFTYLDCGEFQATILPIQRSTINIYHICNLQSFESKAWFGTDKQNSRSAFFADATKKFGRDKVLIGATRRLSQLGQLGSSVSSSRRDDDRLLAVDVGFLGFGNCRGNQHARIRNHHVFVGNTPPKFISTATR